MTTHPAPAHGKYTSHGIPHGYTSLSPHLAVRPARAAIEFYQTAFGAVVHDVTPMGDVIAHATLELESGRFTVSDPMDAYGLVAPDPNGASITLALYVRDVDAIFAKAIAAGAKEREPISTFVSGDRFGSLVDPFGVRWTLMTRVEDLSPEQSAKRVADWAATQPG